jgi:homoserine dehydrogenase
MTTSPSAAPPRHPPGDITVRSDPGIALRPLRIGMIGFGTVGRGFFDLLGRRGEALAARFAVRPSVVAVLVRSSSGDRGSAADQTSFTVDPAAFLARDYDVVVEATGSVDGVDAVVRELLARGTPVVTANKALVAGRGAELAKLASRSGASFRFEASVAAGIPLFQLLERSLQSTRFDRIAAILNGTSNFVLTRVASEGVPVDEALAEARRRGFSEPDASDDVSGLDAARKLAILAGVLWSVEVPAAAIDHTGIAGVRPDDCARAAAFGYRIKPLAVARLGSPPSAWVAPALVPAAHPLAAVVDESNGIQLSGDVVTEIFVSGPGAGAAPTAAALLDDVLAALDGPRTRAADPGRAPAPGGSRPEEDGDGDPWFVTLALERDAIDPRDVVEFLGASGLPFVELRRLEAGGGTATIAGITEPAPRARVDLVRAALGKVPAVRDVRAFRVFQPEVAR